jgi:retron-type reverse transcriptase
VLSSLRKKTVNGNIDNEFDKAFTPQRIVQAFQEYKLAKWDHFSGFDQPKVLIPVGTDGVTHLAFEKQLQRNARNIAYRIQQDRYVFHPFREEDRRKDRARPFSRDNTRTLGIASIRDALVQGILYNDVLYNPVEALFEKLDAKGPVSFAYRRGKSAPRAAQVLQRYIEDGYVHVYDADLSKYFDTIPHEKLLEKVAPLVGGTSTRTYKLIRRFVRTDRTPHATYRYARGRNGEKLGYKAFHRRKPWRMRPKRNRGVPQGGVLSGMLANLYLHSFDEWVINELGKEFDLRYIRYADDFVIMLRDPGLFDKIDKQIQKKLSSDDFSLSLNQEKTIPVDVLKDGLEFVGFHFDGQHVRARQKSLDRFKNRIVEEAFRSVPERIKKKNSLDRTLDWLTWRINWKIRGMRGEEICPRCSFGRIGPPRSWMAFFRVITDLEQLRELDSWIRKMIYDHIYTEFGARVGRKELNGRPRRVRLKSLVHEVYQVRKTRRKPCLCDLEEHGHRLWAFAEDLYQGRSFKTLARPRPFTVPYVGKDSLQVSIGGNQYTIKEKDLQTAWERLLAGETIYRAGLEKDGLRCTSQIVALMAALPGVAVQPLPLSLTYQERGPAGFLAGSN